MERYGGDPPAHPMIAIISFGLCRALESRKRKGV